MPARESSPADPAPSVRRVAFRGLLSPVTPEEFLDAYFDRKPLHLPGPARRFEDLFSWDRASALLGMTPLWTGSTLQVALAGEDLDAGAYCAPQSGRGGADTLQPDPRRVQDLMRRGAAVALRSIETMTPDIAFVAAALQCHFDGEVTCDAHIAACGNRDVTVRFDIHDRFVLQICGTTDWAVYEGRIDEAADVDGFRPDRNPEAHAGPPRGAVCLEAAMTPGDVLYIPRGQLHAVQAPDGAAMYLTFGVERMRGYHFTGAIADTLLQDPVFRQTLPRFDEPDAHRAHLGKLAKQVHAYMQTAGLARSIRREQRLRTVARCFPSYALPSAVPPQVFRVRSLRTRLVRADTGWRVEQANGETALSDSEAAFVKWLMPQDFFTTDEAAAAHGDTASTSAMLQRLQTIGLIDEI
jgi:ribosomal protein L16 Arg81 hydroxylase